MSRSERELAKYRRLLAIAVHRLGGEMKFTEDEFRADYDLGVNTQTKPFVVTAFPLKKS